MPVIAFMHVVGVVIPTKGAREECAPVVSVFFLDDGVYLFLETIVKT